MHDIARIADACQHRLCLRAAEIVEAGPGQQFPAAADGTTLVLGFSTDALFSKTTPIHVLLTIPDHNVHIQLTGTVTSAKTVLSPPASRMSDEDIATLAQIRQSIESVWKMIQSAAQTTN